MNGMKNRVLRPVFLGTIAVAAAFLVMGCDNPTDGSSSDLPTNLDFEMRAAELIHAYENDFQSVTIQLFDGLLGDGSPDPQSNVLPITLIHSEQQPKVPAASYNVVETFPDGEWYAPQGFTHLSYTGGGSAQQFAAVDGTISVVDQAITLGTDDVPAHVQGELEMKLYSSDGSLSDESITVTFQFDGTAEIE